MVLFYHWDVAGACKSSVSKKPMVYGETIGGQIVFPSVALEPPQPFPMLYKQPLLKMLFIKAKPNNTDKYGYCIP